MAKFGMSAKIALVSAVVFLIIGYSSTYNATRKVFGGTLKQTSETKYGRGNKITQYGFVIHALVFAVVMFLILNYGLKLS